MVSIIASWEEEHRLLISSRVEAGTPRPVPSSYQDSWTSTSWASTVSRFSSLSGWEGGREGERGEGGGGREGRREGGREGGWVGGWVGGREGGREGGWVEKREGREEGGGREGGGREGGREGGGREGRKGGGRVGEREGGREGKREGGREVSNRANEIELRYVPAGWTMGFGRVIWEYWTALDGTGFRPWLAGRPKSA